MITCNKCGKEIIFDKTRKSASGKYIPIDKDTNELHNCPNCTYSKKQQTLEPEPVAEPVPEPEAVAQKERPQEEVS